MYNGTLLMNGELTGRYSGEIINGAKKRAVLKDKNSGRDTYYGHISVIHTLGQCLVCVMSRSAPTDSRPSPLHSTA